MFTHCKLAGFIPLRSVRFGYVIGQAIESGGVVSGRRGLASARGRLCLEFSL
jgi:hypothetical protein